MEIKRRPSCNNAPKQEKLITYVTKDLEEKGVSWADFEMALSHGKFASVLVSFEKAKERYEASYFAEFQSYKKDSEIKSVRTIMAKVIKWASA